MVRGNRARPSKYGERQEGIPRVGNALANPTRRHRDRGDGRPLSMKVENHDDFPKFDPAPLRLPGQSGIV